ncbi:hypothetical protein GCM10010916_33350 [Paenibacillus abyssi]|uniref:Uncharacterized protein n=1 Tax=Paenibacillus abyssi TaxID=1340531 RepID=A0A917FW70_9BACL|nr:hypothetical protein GCM10010916_33350 [Paenibacillus abyssi]
MRFTSVIANDMLNDNACKISPSVVWPMPWKGSSTIKYSKSGDILPRIKPVRPIYFGLNNFKGTIYNGCEK